MKLNQADLTPGQMSDPAAFLKIGTSPLSVSRAKSPPTHPEVEVPDQRDVPIASSAGFGLIVFPVLRTAWNAHLHRNTIRGPIFVTDMRIAFMAPHRNPASQIVSLSGAKLAATELKTRSK